MTKKMKALSLSQTYKEEASLLKKVVEWLEPQKHEMDEIWLDIAGFEGLYMISNLGNVYSLRNKKQLKVTKQKSGYIKVNLYKNKKCYTYTIHLLVAKAFVPNVNNLPIVMHKDNIKHNSVATNLSWCTYSNNSQDAIRDGLCNVGKRVLQLADDNSVIRSFDSISDAARYFGKPEQVGGLSLTCNNKQKTWQGHRWRFEK